MSLLLPAHLESCAKPLVWTPRGGNDPQNREYKTAEGCMDHPEDTLEIVFGTQQCKTCLWTKYIWQKHCCCWGVKVGEMVVSLKWITEIMAIQLPPNFPKPCLVWFGFKMPLFSAFSLPLTKSPCKPGYHQNSFLASVPHCTCPLDPQTRSVPTGSMHLQMQRQNCSGCWFSAHVFHTIYRAILIY